MDFVALPLLVFILGCLIHLEWEVSAIKTMVKQNGENPGRKKERKEVKPEDKNDGKIDQKID